MYSVPREISTVFGVQPGARSQRKLSRFVDTRYSAVYRLRGHDDVESILDRVGRMEDVCACFVGRLIAAAKAKPGELKFGSTGIVTGTHVGVEKFNQAAGIKALHVPPSSNDSNADTIANATAARFTYYLVPISLALPHIRDGTLVALGVGTARRSTLLPEVPTIAEAIVARFDFPIWYGRLPLRLAWLASLRMTSGACSPGRICARGSLNTGASQ
ncbi:tripartite tricarboxylate transporter substrate-binding protein [Mesorhizobium australicum]|uniref:tripartite tricarboxylate transporter substrate-binding protein n=1 Tax=Mesorhizobium australicum TaxID=536018 RepID=UPI0033372A2B